MRTRHWLASLLGGALWAATAHVATAQPPYYDPGFYGDPGAGPPAYSPYVDPGSPAAAANSIPYSGYEQAGWPPGAVAWPQISPYMGPPVDQHSYQNGFWFNEQKIGSRRYYVVLAGTLNRFADPNDTVVGNPDAPQSFGFGVAGTGGGQNVQTSGRPIFTAHDWVNVRDHMTSGGFLGQAGFWNADDSGVMLFGSWADEGSSVLRLGHSNLPLLTDTAEILRRAEDILSNHGALPLLDNQLPLTTIAIVPPNAVALQVPGGAQRYDLMYQLTYQSQAYGTGIGYYANPFVEAENFKLRPEIGLRYMRMIENAVFYGADSGLAYTFDLTDLRPTPATITGTVNVLESYLRSNAKAHLGGPEIGLRYDFGSDKFLIWGQSKFGLLANHSTREINGYGILRREAQPGLVVPPRSATTFRQQDTTTNVSPMFEQSVFCRANVLSFVPVVKKMKFFEAAQFQVGYTWTVLGAVYRPGDYIDWRGYPEFPSLTGKKSSWFMNTLSLGVEWDY